MDRINKYMLRLCLVVALVMNASVVVADETQKNSLFGFSMDWFEDSPSDIEQSEQEQLTEDTSNSDALDAEQLEQTTLDDSSQRVTIAEPYIEFHTGPGRGYPVFYVAKRGESLEIIKRKTDWFKVVAAKGQTGWVKRRHLEKTLAPNGQLVAITEAKYDDFTSRKWEVGVLSGQFEGATVNSMYVGYLFTENLSTELWFSQILGDYSESRMVNINLVHQPFPSWVVSPFVTIGTGGIWTEPKTSLVKSDDRNDQTAHYGLGARVYITERYFIRLEYKDYVVFTDRNENDSGEEWKIGLSVFF